MKINKAFLTVSQQDDVESQRGNAHLLGQGLEIAYKSGLDSDTYNVHRLAKAAIDQCGPVFYKENWNIGIGVNTDSVFVGMMEEKEFWVDPLALPSGVSVEQYRASLAARFTSAARESWFVFVVISKCCLVFIVMIIVSEIGTFLG